MSGSNGRARTVAVIGAGASGTLVAADLLRRATRGFRVVLVERRTDAGRGVAYSTRSMRHLLNVTAGNMSALPGDPEHFVRWLRAGPLPYATPQTFAPRPLFGDYLGEVLAEAERLSGGLLERVWGEVIDVRIGDGVATVRLEDGREMRADTAVLALGNLPPQNPRIGDVSFYDGQRYVEDAWAPGALERIPLDMPALLIGTSLTAIDVAIGLKERGHAAPIHAISRRGLVPNPYDLRVTSPPHPPFVSPGGMGGIRALVRRVREEVRLAEVQGRDWHGVVEALRPEAQGLWRAFSEAEKRRFLRHVQPYWESHRHRVAPEIGAEVRDMRARGQLVVHPGRILCCAEDEAGVDVKIRPRGGDEVQSLRVGHVVNCTAPNMFVSSARHQLLRNILRDGEARPGPLGVGLDTDETGALLGADGERSEILFTLGSCRKGQLWETMAVPEIREQSFALAERLLEGRGPRRGGSRATERSGELVPGRG